MGVESLARDLAGATFAGATKRRIEKVMDAERYVADAGVILGPELTASILHQAARLLMETERTGRTFAHFIAAGLTREDAMGDACLTNRGLGAVSQLAALGRPDLPRGYRG